MMGIYESDEVPVYYILGNSPELKENVAFIYTGDGNHSMVPTTTKFRKYMSNDENIHPMFFDTMDEAEMELNKLKETDDSDIDWSILPT